MLNENKKSLGYKISVWNCGRGLLSHRAEQSDKMTDIKLFIQQHNPGLLGIVESDIHGAKSPGHRTTTFTTEEIMEKLFINGYSVYLPDTWFSNGQSRLIVYVRNDIRVIKRPNPDIIKDLPSITFEVGVGRERKSLVFLLLRMDRGHIRTEQSRFTD